VVREPGSEERIWWGTVNQPLDEENFDGLRAKVVAHLDGSDLYVVDALAGASGVYRLRPNRSDEPEQVIAGGELIGLAFDPTGGFVLASSDTVYRFAEGRQ